MGFVSYFHTLVNDNARKILGAESLAKAIVSKHKLNSAQPTPEFKFCDPTLGIDPCDWTWLCPQEKESIVVHCD